MGIKKIVSTTKILSLVMIHYLQPTYPVKQLTKMYIFKICSKHWSIKEIVKNYEAKVWKTSEIQSEPSISGHIFLELSANLEEKDECLRI